MGHDNIHFLEQKTYTCLEAIQKEGYTEKLPVCLQTTQHPFINNNATMAVKLQSASVHYLYIPLSKYTLHLIYVVLSRVFSVKGLFLEKPPRWKNIYKSKAERYFIKYCTISSSRDIEAYR